MSENEKKVQTQKSGKPGLFGRIAKWMRELKSELKKVQWPTAKQTVNSTIIVIACVIVVGVVIALFDGLAGGLYNAIEALFKKG